MPTLRSRRTFLGEVALAASVAAVGLTTGARGESATPADASAALPARKRRMLSPEEFSKRLEGPIQSGAGPFTSDFSVDYAGVRNMVSRGKKFGVKVFALTAGNSQYHVLTLDEIKKTTTTMVEAVGDEEIVIGASGDWWTGQVVDYAKYADSTGADAIQMMRPTRADNEDATLKHFQAVAAVTKLPIVLHGAYTPALLNKLLTIPQIVAMKEDLELALYVDRQIEFGDKLNIFGGGAESRFLVGQPYGAKAFYSTYTGFAPDISMQFWEAASKGNLQKAADITRKYDHPFIKRFSHPFWHATLEYFGVTQRYMRPPQTSYTDEQMKDVKAFFDGQGLDSKKYM